MKSVWRIAYPDDSGARIGYRPGAHTGRSEGIAPESLCGRITKEQGATWRY